MKAMMSRGKNAIQFHNILKIGLKVELYALYRHTYVKIDKDVKLKT